MIVIVNKKKNAEIDGILEFPANDGYQKKSYSLADVLEMYTWNPFKDFVGPLSRMSFDEYKKSFENLNNHYLIMESKNNSDLFYLSYQVDRCFSHHN